MARAHLVLEVGHLPGEQRDDGVLFPLQPSRRLYPVVGETECTFQSIEALRGRLLLERAPLSLALAKPPIELVGDLLHVGPAPIFSMVMQLQGSYHERIELGIKIRCGIGYAV